MKRNYAKIYDKTEKGKEVKRKSSKTYANTENGKKVNAKAEKKYRNSKFGKETIRSNKDLNKPTEYDVW